MHAPRPLLFRRRISNVAFSLIEVVLATGIFAFAIIAVVALLAPGQRQVANIQDAATAARLADLVRAELAAYPFNSIATRIGTPGSKPVELVANRDLSLIRSVDPINIRFSLTIGATTTVHTISNVISANARLAGSANASKPAGSLPVGSYGTALPSLPGARTPQNTAIVSGGIANRDRYFFVRLQPLEEPAMASDVDETGSVPVRVVVYYPFQVPGSGASDGKAEAIDEQDGTKADLAVPDDFDAGEARDINGNAAQRAALDAYLAKLNQFTFNLSLAR